MAGSAGPAGDPPRDWPAGAIRLPTRDGALELTAGAGECTGCKVKGGGLVQIEVVGEEARIVVCGNCLAEGVAILLGRRHVQAGGDVEDLRSDRPG